MRCCLEDSSDEDDDGQEAVVAQVAATDHDTMRLKQLTAYLDMPEAPKGTDILEWYHNHGDEFSRVTLMWRQFHARPASSGGVERLFSGAGKMHGPDAQTMVSSTIQRTLLCAVNCDPWAHTFK
jgi:hypothetical protein